ncbi:MAG: NYN domain-containing protein [Candidatus Hydrogenedentes bacterium]|nr:NYN domain-containing protein [Candidatus Hydrogenedentota bacterium]
MREHYYIDGYNFLCSYYAQPVRGRTKRTLEEAREHLVNFLKEFSAISGCKVTVVFDGKKFMGEKDHRVPKERESVRVIYAPPSSDADSTIESLVYKELYKEKIYVVSSDAVLRQTCLGIGVLVMKPENFLKYSAQLLQSVQIHHKYNAPTVRVETPLSEKIRSVFEDIISQ